jgi:aspartyl protease family protein
VSPGEITPIGWVYVALIGLFILSLLGAVRHIGVVKTLRNIMIWLVIFGGVFLLGIYREDIGQRVRAELDPASARVTAAAGEVRIRGHADGHFWVRADVNGVPTLFLVDTGASEIVLSKKSAAAAGIDLEGLAYTGRAMTANGVVGSAPVKLDSLGIGPIVRAPIGAVVPNGALEVNLLGMRFLRSLKSWRVEGNELILVG